MYDVVILGGGYAGLMAALRLSAWSCPLRVLLVNESATFIERVRLQESLAGAIAPRLPPLPAWLAGTKLNFLEGRVITLDPGRRSVAIQSAEGRSAVLFKRCIYALGSAHDLEQVPGVAEHAYRLDAGDGPRSAAALRDELNKAGRGIRAVVIGGGNTAVEVAAEIKAIRPDMAVSMVAAGTAGDLGKGPKVERKVRAELARQGIALSDDHHVAEVTARTIVTKSGEVVAADLVVWAGGLSCPPIAAAAGIAVDASNRIWVDGAFRSISHPWVVAIGDAARPLAPTGAAYRPSAFAALTSGAYAGGSLLEEAKGKVPRPFSFSAYGQGIAIGHSGVGFLTYPNDGEGYAVLGGRLALRIRNLFVRSLIWFLRLERLQPGLCLFWIGRRRVSWAEANALVDKLPAGNAGSITASPATPSRFSNP
jgi:NADH dehydrogenase